jgi:hypothetical protein
LNSKAGIITSVKLFSDSLYPQMIDLITKHLKGAKYTKAGVSEALNNAADEAPNGDIWDFIREYSLWLVNEL